MSLEIYYRTGLLEKIYVHDHKGTVTLQREDIVLHLTSDVEGTEVIAFIPRENAAAFAARILELDGLNEWCDVAHSE